MAMPDLGRIWSREEVLALPDDGNRYELIAGQLLVTPSPRLLHQVALWALYDLVAPYVRQHRLGITGLSPADLRLGGEHLSQPDLFVIPWREELAAGGWAGLEVPILAAEILSPSTERYDRITKRRAYQAAGVGTYWIVDLDARWVEVWRPKQPRPVVADRMLEWQPEPSVPALEIDLSQYFRPEWR
jgi:Uma2 family endonuclease